VEKRGSGILLHITSLPSPYGIGDMGAGAYRFVDFLKETNQSFWQILPLNPTVTIYGNSPYNSFSVFAGNPLLISPEIMVEDGILSNSDIENHPLFPEMRVNYELVTEFKNKIFQTAFKKNKEKLERDGEFERFCSENAFWLDDYALFITIKRYFNEVDWSRWPMDLKERKGDTLNEWKQRLSEDIGKEKFLQYIFFKQWHSLRNYCNDKNIKIIGDIPIYVNFDSSDVWANPHIFKLDDRKMPLFVAGVPPDYFSSTGQLWGHPVYNWDVLKETRYSWWISRIGHNLKLTDMIRLDHFRGFVAYWEIPVGEKTAINGKWIKAPVKDFFNTLLEYFPGIPIVAEDLGIITPDVREIMDLFGFPGMKVLLFAFGKDLPTNPYAPHNHIKNCVVYTGTHDSNTIKGWLKKELDREGRKRLSEYMGKKVSEKAIHWDIVRFALMSVADMVIIPMQDILGLGEKTRMNLPASFKGNWQWRLKLEQISPSLIKKLSEMTIIYGRGKTN